MPGFVQDNRHQLTSCASVEQAWLIEQEKYYISSVMVYCVSYADIVSGWFTTVCDLMV